MPTPSRIVTAEIMRFVRGAQGMTGDERAWFMARIEPIVAEAIRAEREACAGICDAYTADICANAIRMRSTEGEQQGPDL